MAASGVSGKQMPRANYSVGLSVAEAQAIDAAVARTASASRAEFIRAAAVAAANDALAGPFRPPPRRHARRTAAAV